MISSEVSNITVLAACRKFDTINSFISYFDMLDYDVSCYTQYGYDCIENALLKKPDVIISDMILYDFDALELAERIRSYTELDGTALIVITEVNDTSYINGVLSAGADDIIVRPFDCVALDKRIRRAISRRHEMSQNALCCDMEKEFAVKAQIRSVLGELAMPCSMLGYTYTCLAVWIAINDADSVSSVTKSIYPEISKEYKVSVTTIERNIRSAIDKAWRSADAVTSENILGVKHRLTNRQFIAAVADRVRKELKL